jgi:hypothetical protein
MPSGAPSSCSFRAIWILTAALVGAAIAACAAPPPDPLSGDDSSPDSTTPTKTTKKRPDGGAGPVGGQGAASEDGDNGASGAGGASKNQRGGATPPGACIAPATSSDSGHHNPGKDCLSCHATIEGKTWTIAGTLQDATGAGIPGATIEVTDADGQTLQLVTAANGNFYTLKPVSFPVKPRASKCPSDQAMSSTAQNGSCNASGCHDSSNPIHL